MSSSAADGDGLQLHDPQTLYRRWEASQWSPFDIDLHGDRQQWQAMSATQRELVHFVLLSVADSLKLPGDAGGELLGVSENDIRAFALGGLTRRLKIIGVPPESVLA